MMTHFYDKIPGWFNWERIYQRVIDAAVDGAKIVEVGAYFGRSSAYLVTEKVRSGKHIEIDIVDTWWGSQEHQHLGWLMPRFMRNMAPLSGHFNAVCLPSHLAAKLYDTVDFVFLDASHDYHNVDRDIESWKRKTCILAGHDYKPDEFPGVCSAVKKHFGQYYVDTASSVWWVEIKPGKIRSSILNGLFREDQKHY
jgi:hypothetical protein